MRGKSTPEQIFAKIFMTWMHPGTEEGPRKNAEQKVDQWLARHAKTRADIPAILAQSAKDYEAQEAECASASDPRDSAPHPFDSAEFSVAGVVEGFVSKYVMMHPHVLTVFSLWICFTHVFQQFAIAPRVALISEEPACGKTTALEVARHLVSRPNPESLGTGAAIGDFLDQGPGSILLDELDQVDKEGRRRLQLIWNLGHKRRAMYSMMIKGKRKLISLYAPVLAAGVGSFLATTQKSRTFNLEMTAYDANSKPECEYTTEQDFSNFDVVYAYLRHWARTVQLNLKPDLSGLILRHADNVRGLISIADSCGPQWGRKAREAALALFAKEQAEHPKIVICRHALVICDTLGIDRIESRRVDRELKLLDLPDFDWTRYQGASGLDYAHPITPHERARLLAMVKIKSTLIRFPNGPARGYYRAQFEEALRNESEPSRSRLRLVGSDV